jgi:hypothetical protein
MTILDKMTLPDDHVDCGKAILVHGADNLEIKHCSSLILRYF